MQNDLHSTIHCSVMEERTNVYISSGIMIIKRKCHACFRTRVSNVTKLERERTRLYSR